MITTAIQTAIRELIAKVPFDIKFRTGLVANINATATKNLARQGMPHYAVDTGVFYIFDGDNNIPAVAYKPYSEKTDNYTALVDDHTINFTANTKTLTLPTAVGFKGREYLIINNGTGLITVDGNSSETINGSTTVLLYPNEILTIRSDNANWIGYHSSTKKAPRCLFDHYTDAGNVDTDETDLYSDTLPANCLSTNGDKIIASYSGTMVEGSNRRLQIYFAGVSIFDTGDLFMVPGSDFKAEVQIIRTGSGTIRYSIFVAVPLGSLPTYNSIGELSGLTFTGTNILKITGQSDSATDDVVAQMGMITWFPVA